MIFKYFSLILFFICAVSAKDNLYPGECVTSGEILLTSQNGCFQADTLSNGALLIKRTADYANIAITGRSLSWPDKFCFQKDGNFVSYRGNNAVWSTKTNGDGGAVIRMQNDGNLVMYTPPGQAVWSTNSVSKCRL